MLELVQAGDRASPGSRDSVDLTFGVPPFPQDEVGGSPGRLRSHEQGLVGVEPDLGPALGGCADGPEEERDATRAQCRRGDHHVFVDNDGSAEGIEGCMDKLTNVFVMN